MPNRPISAGVFVYVLIVTENSTKKEFEKQKSEKKEVFILTLSYWIVNVVISVDFWTISSFLPLHSPFLQISGQFCNRACNTNVTTLGKDVPVSLTK